MKMQRPDLGSTVYYVRYVWTQGYSSAQYEVQAVADEWTRRLRESWRTL